MEPTFNTSFIPKEPAGSASPKSSVLRTKKRGRQAYSIGFFVAMLLALGAVLVTAGILFYANVIKVSIAQKQEELSARYAELDIDIVTELREFDARLRAAEKIAESHVAFSHFFTLLERYTLRRGVRYTQMNFTYVDGVPRVALSGEAEVLRNVALQMDAFRRAGVFNSVDLSGVQRGGQNEVSTFSITLHFPAEEISFLAKGGVANAEAIVDTPTPTPTTLDAIPLSISTQEAPVITPSSTSPALSPNTPLDSENAIQNNPTTDAGQDDVLSPPFVQGTAPGVPLIPLQ
jgi:hypothetical protein